MGTSPLIFASALGKPMCGKPYWSQTARFVHLIYTAGLVLLKGPSYCCPVSIGSLILFLISGYNVFRGNLSGYYLIGVSVCTGCLAIMIMNILVCSNLPNIDEDNHKDILMRISLVSLSSMLFCFSNKIVLTIYLFIIHCLGIMFCSRLLLPNNGF